MSITLPSATRPITGKMVLIWIVAFFAVIIAVNLTFVYFALDSWPGLTTQKAYEEGVAYNKTLESAARQDAMGWRSHVALGPSTPKGTRMLTLTMTGPDGPLAGLAAQARLTRPLGKGLTVDAKLAEDRPGLYAALLRLPALGRWQVEVTARAPDGRSFRMVHEIQAGDAK
ncbi:MAG: FixH family protein [Alphaproteobacteria bacterium]